MAVVLCVAELLWNLSFPNIDLFLHSLIGKPEHAIWTACNKLGMWSYSEYIRNISLHVNILTDLALRPLPLPDWTGVFDLFASK